MTPCAICGRPAAKAMTVVFFVDHIKTRAHRAVCSTSCANVMRQRKPAPLSIGSTQRTGAA